MKKNIRLINYLKELEQHFKNDRWPLDYSIIVQDVLIRGAPKVFGKLQQWIKKQNLSIDVEKSSIVLKRKDFKCRLMNTNAKNARRRLAKIKK